MAERWTKTTVWLPGLEGGLATRWRQRLDKLSIKEAAIDDGNNNLPESGATSISSKENEIVNVYLEGRDTLLDWLRERIAAASARIRGLIGEPFSASTWIGECKGVVSAAVQSRKQEIDKACLKESRAHRALNRFEALHDRSGSPQTPTAPHVVLSIGILVFCIALETGLNMQFFSKGVGLIEGAMTAIIVSATNIGLGVVAGYVGLRLAINRYPVPRVAGWAIFLACFFLAVLANLFYAHAREVNLDSPEGGFDPQAAIAHMSADPLAIGSSLLLFALGMMMFMVGVLDGRSGFSDPYWDYSKTAKAYDSAAKDVSRLLDDVRDEIKRKMQGQTQRLDNVQQDAQRAAHSAQAAVEQARARKGEVEDSVANLANLCRVGLKEYRSQNVKVRDGRPPAYFANAEHPPLPGVVISVDSLLDLQLSADQWLNQVTTEVASARAQIAQFQEKQLAVEIEEALARARREASESVDQDEAARARYARANGDQQDQADPN